MRAYWDSSALVQAAIQIPLRRRLSAERGVTRTHTLAEVFSTLTGKLSVRMEVNAASQTVEDLARDLDFIDLSPGEVIAALKQARGRGVRGGRVHDFLHAVVADKVKAGQLLTLDQDDFHGLTDTVEVVELEQTSE